MFPRPNKHQNKLSGPLLDRIDLHIEVPAVTAADLILPRRRRRAAARSPPASRARDIQATRYAALGLAGVLTNAQASGPVLEEVARTLADLDSAEKVGRVHLAEALSYRALADELRRAA